MSVRYTENGTDYTSWAIDEGEDILLFSMMVRQLINDFGGKRHRSA